MESFFKVLGLLTTSIKSLRWWAFCVVCVCAYLKWSPAPYQPFVGAAYLNAEGRLEVLGLVMICAVAVFILGWVASGFDQVFSWRQREKDKLATHRHMVDELRAERRKRRAEERLRRTKERQVIRTLSPTQLQMVHASLRSPVGILKVSNDAALDTATLLVTKGVFDRIRPWYNDHGGVVGEVFVVRDWIQALARDELPRLGLTR